jgi:hypothetical protein
MMLQESNTTSTFLNKSRGSESGFPVSTFDERLRQFERVSKSAFCKSNTRNGNANVTIYYAREDYVAKTMDQLSLFRGDKVKALDCSGGPHMLVSVAGETGFVPSSVLTLTPTEFIVPSPLLLKESTKKIVRFKEEPEEISYPHDDLMLTSRVSSIDDLPGIVIATGVPSKDSSQMLRVYAGNFSQEWSGYRTLLASEGDTMEQLIKSAIQRFRLTLNQSNLGAYLTLENPDTHHSLLLPDPRITTLGTVIELAKRATQMQGPIPKESSNGLRRLAKKIAKIQNGRKPAWCQIDNRSIGSDSSGELVPTDQPSLLGLTRDPSSDFETGYKLYLNLGSGEEL